MDTTWILLGLLGWALALVFVLVLMRMAGQEDRAARHGEKELDPFSDVTITKVGEPPKVTIPKAGGLPKATIAKAGKPPNGR